MKSSNFQKQPFVKVNGVYPVCNNWEEIGIQLNSDCEKIVKTVKIIVVEYYQGVLDENVSEKLITELKPKLFIDAKDAYWAEEKIKEMVHPDVTDDRIFGFLSSLNIQSYFDDKKLANILHQINSVKEGIILIVGTGASCITKQIDILVYADMARWEIQLRMRKNLVNNLGLNNKGKSDYTEMYKHAYFVDWRVCDRLKKSLMLQWDYVLDTNNINEPKLVTAKAVFEGLKECLHRPFSVVPFFDPGPWGGQWMKEFCNLDPMPANYAWCFNCVPEENSLLLKIGESIIEIPSINLVFLHPESLLGPHVYQEFGDEFPIRFDFLDTVEGGNLSLQVHPLKEYIKENFGMAYTQDESYYMIYAKPGATVYLGLKEDIKPEAMIKDLESAQQGLKNFDADQHVQIWSAQKHDHFLIPAGTVHCSGKDGMVLEISATPYIFTFKLWDWGRLGMDGKPRPINIEHGRKNIIWDRTTKWVKENLINNIQEIANGPGWLEERTGLHESQFIETRRHWFTEKVHHVTNNTVEVICLVEGEEAIVECPSNSFEPFIVHYAETFIIPSLIKEYTIRPLNTAVEHATLKAFVRKK